MPEVTKYKPVVYPYCCDCTNLATGKCMEPVKIQQQRIMRSFEEYFREQGWLLGDWTIDAPQQYSRVWLDRTRVRGLLLGLRRGDAVLVASGRYCFVAHKDALAVCTKLREKSVSLYVAYKAAMLNHPAQITLLREVYEASRFRRHSRMPVKFVPRESFRSEYVFDRTVRGKKHVWVWNESKWVLVCNLIRWQRMGLSAQKIAEALRDQNVAHPRKREWSASDVRTAIAAKKRLEKLIRLIEGRRLVRESVDPNLWDEVQKEIERRPRLSRRFHSAIAKSGGMRPRSFQYLLEEDTSPDEPPDHQPPSDHHLSNTEAAGQTPEDASVPPTTETPVQKLGPCGSSSPGETP